MALPCAPSLARGWAFLNLVVCTSWARLRHGGYLHISSQSSCMSLSSQPFLGLTLTPLLQLREQHGQRGWLHPAAPGLPQGRHGVSAGAAGLPRAGGHYRQERGDRFPLCCAREQPPDHRGGSDFKAGGKVGLEWVLSVL